MANRAKPIEPLSEQEIADLIRAARPESLTGARARALISLLAYGGLRISEALAVRPQDVDLEAGTVSVLRGKGGKQRVVALLPEGVPHVERWMRRRKKLASPSSPLLCTVKQGANASAKLAMQPGRPLCRNYAQHLLRRLAERAGIERRVHPHGLRHSHAALLALRGKLPTDIRDQLGHSSLGTTSTYLEAFAPAARVARIRDEPTFRQPAMSRLADALNGLSADDAALLADLLRERALERTPA